MGASKSWSASEIVMRGSLSDEDARDSVAGYLCTVSVDCVRVGNGVEAKEQ